MKPKTKRTLRNIARTLGSMFLAPYIAMVLWNWQLVPALHVPTVSYGVMFWCGFFLGIGNYAYLHGLVKNALKEYDEEWAEANPQDDDQDENAAA